MVNIEYKGVSSVKSPIQLLHAVPARFNLWVMLFTSCWVVYMLRVNMSLNLIAMVPQTHSNSSANSSEMFRYRTRSQCGPKNDVFSNETLQRVDGVDVHAAHVKGFIYPALHALVARWAPPAEKGKFVSAMMGGTLGTVLTWSLTGPLMEKFGWASAFYVPAALTLVWCFFWWYLVADTPSEHPRITEAEKNYILDALGDKVKKSKGLPPFKSIVTSLPFLAMTILHYGNLWGLYFIMTVGPKFVSSVLGFELSAAGVISALPYLARLFLATIFGVVGDFILARKLMSTTAIRKFFCLFSHILPGVLLVLLVYAGCSTALSVSLITMSMGFNGAATLTNLQNHQDLAPNYAGTLYGIANCVGSTAGFFTPMITAYFTSSGNSFESWRPVFFVGASVYIISALFFIFFGTGNIQPWNFAPEDKGKDDKSNGDLKEMNGSPPKNSETKEIKETTLNVSK
ncbi:hypothetical protein HF086_012950 [Spodoptera exigua]|uniref:Sodium-dependent phosphate transporter n=1 Tax=Spodoptera exigua TaxID=7107 RepID=A0A922ML88_SPOEX|nr:hypothetical protein HF086_012950 [Spodoptera exigua]